MRDLPEWLGRTDNSVPPSRVKDLLRSERVTAARNVSAMSSASCAANTTTLSRSSLAARTGNPTCNFFVTNATGPKPRLT